MTDSTREATSGDSGVTTERTREIVRAELLDASQSKEAAVREQRFGDAWEWRQKERTLQQEMATFPAWELRESAPPPTTKVQTVTPLTHLHLDYLKVVAEFRHDTVLHGGSWRDCSMALCTGLREIESHIREQLEQKEKE